MKRLESGKGKRRLVRPWVARRLVPLAQHGCRSNRVLCLAWRHGERAAARRQNLSLSTL